MAELSLLKTLLHVAAASTQGPDGTRDDVELLPDAVIEVLEEHAVLGGDKVPVSEYVRLLDFFAQLFQVNIFGALDFRCNLAEAG